MKCCEFPFVVTSQKMNAAKCCYLPSAVTTLRLEILCLVCFKLQRKQQTADGVSEA